jgi:Mg-chelatase subunit ChlD
MKTQITITPTMKTKVVALALFGLTTASIAFYPMAKASLTAPPLIPIDQHIDKPIENQHAKIEVVFVLDTTGSMGGLIDAAKENIWSIATTMASAQTAPDISIGLVAYRDRGDDFVTKVVDLSSDLDSVYATLMDFEAAGGGDGPESVNAALYDSINSISWSQDTDTYKVVFLVGDAPPHMDYPNEMKYPEILKTAAARGIIVNSIQCGEYAAATRPWQQIAQLAGGRYFQVEQSGSAVAIATPFDARIASLSRSLDETRLYYGDADEKLKQEERQRAVDKLHRESSAAALAKRANFNTSTSGDKNFLGEGELVDDVASGRVLLEEIVVTALPAPLQAMSPAEQEAVIEAHAEKRSELKKQIQALASQRKDYLSDKVAEMDNAESSLDYQIFGAVREQAGKVGLKYDSEAPAL